MEGILIVILHEDSYVEILKRKLCEYFNCSEYEIDTIIAKVKREYKEKEREAGKNKSRNLYYE